MTVPHTPQTGGTPKRENKSQRPPPRHSTIRRSKRRIPALPSVVAVMMNADTVGPRRMAAAFSRPDAASPSLYGRRPRPSSESTHGDQTIHEKAKAITKKEISG